MISSHFHHPKSTRKSLCTTFKFQLHHTSNESSISTTHAMPKPSSFLCCTFPSTDHHQCYLIMRASSSSSYTNRKRKKVAMAGCKVHDHHHHYHLVFNFHTYNFIYFQSNLQITLLPLLLRHLIISLRIQ
jgi:hypothetical protein